MNYKNIGPNVRKIRERLGFTQMKLASKTKLSQSLIAQIESGKSTPSMKSLGKIAAALNVEIAILMDGGGND